ncbi:FxsA family protein [Bacillus solimangrovi]|uniref:Membrane protein FxsA n=1 Tax=Bacillus solimangrovi TaxID=1305675 RepID=A0A1E5LCY4_9BACI|nr:FxsA family protein [Bacillus solimangrovi]OEH91920.1 membrane protein FxsA [Bacillus solimangrovi]
MRYILPFLIIVPAFEIGLLILSGNTLGVWPTILLIILTGVTGAWLAKKEGLQTLQLAQIQLQNGQLPNEAIMDGICILIGGVVLLTPGFITDALGFMLLLPLSRGVIKIWLRKVIQRMIDRGQIHITRRF